MLTEYDVQQQRLEYLRGELRAERISYGELAELESLSAAINPSDVELLEAAGVPEHNQTRYAHENDARRSVRLKAERSKRANARIDAYVTRRRRELAENEQTLIEAREPAWDDRRLPAPYDWERDCLSVNGAGI